MILNYILSHPYLVIWTALLLMFERAMYCGYIIDDDRCLYHMKIRREQLVAKPHKSLSFYLDFLRGCFYGAGMFRNAVQEHLFTVILHGVNCSLIYKATGSLLAAMLYMLNPIFSQTAVWLNGRRYAISLLAVLLAWNFWPLAPFMAIVCAWLHVSGVLMPVLFLWTPYWPITAAGMGLAYFFGKDQIKNTIRQRASEYRPGNEGLIVSLRKAILYVKTIGYQFWSCVIPVKPAMYNDFLYYFGQTEEGNKQAYKLNLQFWAGLATLSWLIYLIAFHRSFWAFWFLLFISQWCNIYQVTMTAANRYLTISGVGVMALLAQTIGQLPAPYSAALAGALFAFYITKYRPLLFAYRSTEFFHQYNIALQPDFVAPRYFLAKYYLGKKEPFSAFAVVRQGLRFHPTDFKLMLVFIESLFAIGKVKHALRAIDVAERHIPIGEEDDTKRFFDGVRGKFEKEYRAVKEEDRQKKRVHIHNDGKPYIKPADQE